MSRPTAPLTLPPAFLSFPCAQAHMEIMANPMGDQRDISSEAAASPDASDGTPVRPRGISFPCHRTPVGNWNPTKERSRLSGAGGSPTECFRDYLSGCQGREEEEEEEVRVPRMKQMKSLPTAVPGSNFRLVQFFISCLRTAVCVCQLLIAPLDQFYRFASLSLEVYIPLPGCISLTPMSPPFLFGKISAAAPMPNRSSSRGTTVARARENSARRRPRRLSRHPPLPRPTAPPESRALAPPPWAYPARSWPVSSETLATATRRRSAGATAPATRLSLGTPPR